jgi:hypothetical protein
MDMEQALALPKIGQAGRLIQKSSVMAGHCSPLNLMTLLLWRKLKMIVDIEGWTPEPYGRSLYGCFPCDVTVLYEMTDFKLFKRVTSDWKQTTFVSGPPTPPDDAKRAKLRAKRKKK